MEIGILILCVGMPAAYTIYICCAIQKTIKANEDRMFDIKSQLDLIDIENMILNDKARKSLSFNLNKTTCEIDLSVDIKRTETCNKCGHSVYMDYDNFIRNYDNGSYHTTCPICDNEFEIPKHISYPIIAERKRFNREVLEKNYKKID